MFDFCIDCIIENQTNTSFILIGIQIATFIVALFAYRLARANLNRLTRTQLIQSHMNLISLEFQVRKSLVDLKLTTNVYDQLCRSQPTLTQLPFEVEKAKWEKDKAFELCLSSADQLASLILTESLREQFIDRNWEQDYSRIFNEVKLYAIGPIGFEEMVRNVNTVLNQWEMNNS